LKSNYLGLRAKKVSFESDIGSQSWVEFKATIDDEFKPIR